MDETRSIEFPPENESTEWLLRLQAWSHGGDALLLEAANEMAALRKDAERYRWLRERHEVLCRMYTAKGLGLDLSAVYVRSAEQFDGVIDATMAAGGAAVGAA